MANAAYPSWKALVGNAGIGEAALDLTSAVFKVTLVTSAYTYSAAHEDEADLTGVVGTAEEIPTPAFTGSVLDAADVTFAALSGSAVAAFVLYVDTGTPSTSPLMLFLNTSVTGLPFTPSGGDVQIQWDNGANKIYNLGGG